MKNYGYIKEHESKWGIKYKKEHDYISFIKRSNLVSCSRHVFIENEGGYIPNPVPINMQELKAINMKCKELGWEE